MKKSEERFRLQRFVFESHSGGTLCRYMIVACQLDKVIGSSFIKDAVIIAFIANETISMIENAGLMGVPIPPIIMRAIDILQKKSEGENGNDKNLS